MVVRNTRPKNRRDKGHNRGCGKSCRPSCCPDTPPKTINLLIGNKSQSPTCPCSHVALTYEESTNPDGLTGMWVNTAAAVNCESGCSEKPVKIEFWCKRQTCEDCGCDCQNWSIRINEGDIVRVSDAQAPITDHCCCNGFGRNWAFFQQITAGTGNCSSELFWAVATWKEKDTCVEIVQTTCCIAPISRKLLACVSGQCGGGLVCFEIEADGELDCDHSAGCNVTWSGSSTIGCKNSAGECVTSSVSVKLCCDSEEPPDSDGVPSHWYTDLTVDGFTDRLLGDPDCPDCGSQSFHFGPTSTSVTIVGQPTCDHPDNSYAVEIFDICLLNDQCPGGTPHHLQVLLVDDEDCVCGRGEIHFDPTADNLCGCTGEWIGWISLECKTGGGCELDNVKVRMCTECQECDVNDCQCNQLKISINDGPLKSAIDCCCVNSFMRGWFEFGDVIAGATATPCNGRTIYATVWALEDSSMPKVEGCYSPISSSLNVDFTDTCGVSRTVLVSGGNTCSDPDNFGVWTNSDVTVGCWDGANCHLLRNCTITVRYTRQYEWEVELTGCWNESPNTDTPDVDCGECKDPLLPSGTVLTGTWAGPFSGCASKCNTTNSIDYTITENTDLAL